MEKAIKKSVVVTSFDIQVIEDLQDYISQNFDMSDMTSWLGNEVIINVSDTMFIVSDNDNDETVITCIQEDAPFVERLVFNAMLRWPWLSHGVRDLAEQWTQAIRWSLLRDLIQDYWDEYTVLGFEVGMEDDEADNQIFASQTMISTRMSLVIDEAKKIEQDLAAYEIRYEAID